MKTVFPCLMIWLAVAFCPGTCSAYTLTFDDIPNGEGCAYYNQLYGIHIGVEFSVADHSTCTWGPPHSGSNVLAVTGPISPALLIAFKVYPTGPYCVQSVGAYFSVEQGTVLDLSAYTAGGYRLGGVLIGAAEEAWKNRYIELRFNGLSYVQISKPSDPDALTHFCLDDLTVEPVPEPSSVAALAFGLVPLGLAAVRRRRMS